MSLSVHRLITIEGICIRQKNSLANICNTYLKFDTAASDKVCMQIEVSSQQTIQMLL